MRINDLTSGGLNGSAPDRVSSSQGLGAYGPTGRGGYGAGSDQVQLSGASRVASSALMAHSARLDQLRNLVTTGQYQPSSEAVSKAILDDVIAG